MFNPWRRRPIDLKRAGLGGVLGGRAGSPCGELRDPFDRKCVISVETHLSYQIHKAMQITLQGKDGASIFAIESCPTIISVFVAAAPPPPPLVRPLAPVEQTELHLRPLQRRQRVQPLLHPRAVHGRPRKGAAPSDSPSLPNEFSIGCVNRATSGFVELVLLLCRCSSG